MKLKNLINLKPKVAKGKTININSKNAIRRREREKNDEYHVPLSLSVEISKNWKGKSPDNLIGVLGTLPKEIKTLFSNSELKTVVARQGYSLFILDNHFTFKIKDVKIGNNHKQEITIKHGKKRVFHTTV